MGRYPDGLWTIGRLVTVAVVLLTALSQSAAASTREANELAAAENRATQAEATIADTEDRIEAINQRLRFLDPRVKRAAAEASVRDEAADSAEAKAERAKNEVVAARSAASRQIETAEAEHESDLDGWRASQALAVGVGLFAGLLAFGLLFWQGLVVSSAVAWLRGAAIPVKVGIVATAMLIPVVAGVALLGAGSRTSSIIAGALIGAGLGLGVLGILLLGGAAVLRGLVSSTWHYVVRASQLLRWPAFAVLAAMTVAAFAIAAVDDGPGPLQVDPKLQLQARLAATPDASLPPRVLSLQERADKKRAVAERLIRASESLSDKTDPLESQLADLKEEQRQAQHDSAEAQKDAVHWQQQLAEPDAVATAPAQPTPPAATSSSCDPNYTGCVPPYPPDVDCDQISGPVQVLGSDPHGLDSDGDGTACES